MQRARPTIDNRIKAFSDAWNDYVERKTFPLFVEFALALNALTEQFSKLKLPGLVRLCEGLENTALPLFGENDTHPLKPDDMINLQRQVESLTGAIDAAHVHSQSDTRGDSATSKVAVSAEPDWAKPRDIWLVAEENHRWVAGLVEQFTFFGFHIQHFTWSDALDGASPLALLCIPPESGYVQAQNAAMAKMRSAHTTSQIFALNVPKSLDVIVELLRAGVDITISIEQETTTVLARVLDLAQSQEHIPFRVLVVEDSSTANLTIRRALRTHGIDSHGIKNPQQLLSAVEFYRPDLVLMDMHMPHCTGVEATRVLRQLTYYQSLPVVYLSSETDMGMQVEALRLGGDQFLTKPFNPIILGAVVKTKIERFREMQRSSQLDGLTGLLNHSATKTRLAQLLGGVSAKKDKLCVVMIDIDHFKSVNDLYGHPVGDQVIRSLAWLLKGRLRAIDIVGRYGGEEFLVVLRNADIAEAHRVLDRIRVDFARLPHAHAGGTLRCAFSAGVAAYPIYQTINELTQAADGALLAAKRLGRNRVERAPH
jgi:diguanylate cyclase (GGDEF)-like protein